MIRGAILSTQSLDKDCRCRRRYISCPGSEHGQRCPRARNETCTTATSCIITIPQHRGMLAGKLASGSIFQERIQKDHEVHKRNGSFIKQQIPSVVLISLDFEQKNLFIITDILRSPNSVGEIQPDIGFHLSAWPAMDECHSPPTKLYYFGPSNGGREVTAPNVNKLGDLDDNVLNLDLAKDQLKNMKDGPYIHLFGSVAAVRSFLTAHNINEKSSGSCSMCEIDISKLKDVKLYKVSSITALGIVASKPMPEYLGRGKILQGAIRQLA